MGEIAYEGQRIREARGEDVDCTADVTVERVLTSNELRSGRTHPSSGGRGRNVLLFGTNERNVR
jgi:hypothetical protein